MSEEAKPIAIALSGGGFRATLFHLGVIRLLHERDKLKSVKYLGAVSGGSVLAAHLVLNWDLYREDFDTAAAKLIQATQADVRGQIIRRSIFAWLTIIPRFLLPRRYRWTVGNLLQLLFCTNLFGAKKLQDLREGKEPPEAFFNCTSLTTGSACYFSSDSFTWYEKEEDEETGNFEVRKKFVSSDETLVSFAVAASAAFPPLFPPVEISNDTLVTKKVRFRDVLRLTDGGVFDNLGIDRLLDRAKGVKLLLVSDAEGDFDAEYDKRYAWPISRNIRASELLMTRVSSLQLDVLDSRGTLASQGTKIVKIGIKDVIEYKDDEKQYKKRLTVEQQRATAKIRTDLDVFSTEEVSALILHGYNVAQFSLFEEGILDKPYSEMQWPRFATFPGAYPKLKEKLVKSSKRRLRLIAWDVMTGLNVIVIACLLFGIYRWSQWGYIVAEQNFRAAGAFQAAAEAASQISKLNAQLDKQKTVATTAFQVCQGEFESQCPPKSKWLDCGRSIDEITGPMCSNVAITRVSTRDGNRCGYGISQVYCSFEVPNIGGIYTCEGNCSGRGQIIQSGSNVTCINENGSSVNGIVTGRRTFDGCWGLHADLSEDLSRIDWHNGTSWIRQAQR